MSHEPNLTYAMLERLGRAIVAGRYDDRPFPIEADLAKTNGVSRSVTREAVKMLTAKGLVRAKPRQGTMVQPLRNWNLFDEDVLRWIMDRPLSAAMMRDFTQLRAAIEPEAAALAATAQNGASIRLIREKLDDMTAAENGHGDPVAADIAFHVTILDATNNPFFARLQAAVAAGLQVTVEFDGGNRACLTSLDAHVAVVEAIEAQDPQAARAAMNTLIAAALRLVEARAPRRNEEADNSRAAWG